MVVNLSSYYRSNGFLANNIPGLLPIAIVFLFIRTQLEVKS